MKRNLFKGFWAVWAVFSAFQASSNNISPSPTSPPSCNLPAPEGFELIEMGTDWATFKWSAVPGAWAYQVKALRQPAGILDADETTANTTITLNNLSPGGSYLFSVAAICDNHVVSRFSARTTKTIIVLDIVIKGHDIPSCSLVDWPNSQIGCVEGNWQNDNLSRYWMKITRSNPSTCALFNIEPNDLSTNVVVSYSAISSQVAAIISEDVCTDAGSTGVTMVNTNNTYLSFSEEGQEIAQLTFVKFSQTGTQKIRVCAEDLDGSAGYGISFYKDLCPLPDQIKDRSLTQLTENEAAKLRLVLAKNPVQDEIIGKVFMADPQPYSLSLYDLSGQIRYKQYFESEATPQWWALKAKDLIPGIYFLQAQSGRDTQVVKVLKVE